MPFKASVDGINTISSFLTETEWEELKQSKPVIKMLCCGNPGHMKKNKYGTKYFVHNRRGDCDSEPESQEHLILKDRLAKLCQIYTSIVDVERVGTDWKADVYAEKEDQKYIFEIQLSRIPVEEIIERSNKYIRDEIIPIWIVKKWNNHVLDSPKDRFSIKNLPNSVVFDHYLNYLRKYGFLVVPIENFTELYQWSIHFTTLHGENVSPEKFIESIFTNDYIDTCRAEIERICQKYNKLNQFIENNPQSLEILNVPYTHPNGQDAICPNCGHHLRRELVVHNSHYYQAGIRCTKCQHFEGNEDHFEYSNKCAHCNETGLKVFERITDFEGENYCIQTRCLNCESVNIIVKGEFSKDLEKYIRNGITFRKNRGKQYQQNKRGVYPSKNLKTQNREVGFNKPLDLEFRIANLRESDNKEISDSSLTVRLSNKKSTSNSADGNEEITIKNEHNPVFPYLLKDNKDRSPNLGFILSIDSSKVHAIKCLNCENKWELSSGELLEDKFMYAKYGNFYGQVDVTCKICNSKYLHR